jgi:hypothetical protein
MVADAGDQAARQYLDFLRSHHPQQERPHGLPACRGPVLRQCKQHRIIPDSSSLHVIDQHGTGASRV